MSDTHSISKALLLGPVHPLRGGIADTSASLGVALTRQGVETEIISYRYQYPSFLFPGKSQYTEDPPPPELPPVHRLLHSLRPDAWWRTARYIKRFAPDFILTRFWMPFFGPALGTVHRQVKGHTLRLAMVDNLTPHEKRVGDQSLTAYFTGACDGFVAMSTPVAQDIQHFSQAPLLQLPHPINEGLGEKCDAQEARKALGLPPRGVQLLFFGLIRPYKGLDLLLEALARTELQTQDWHLVVAGEFYEDPRPYHELVQRLGLDQQVRFDEGFVPSDKIPLYFSAADLVTQTYRSATQSGITQMAYHFDCPMLVTEVGGLSEMVDDRQGGYVVPPEPASIAHAIDHFISRGKKEEFVAHVHEKKAEYRWEVFVDALLAFVSETKAVKTKR